MKIALVDASGFSAPYDEHLCHGLAELGHQVRLFVRPPRPGETWRSDAFERTHSHFRLSERLFPRSARIRAMSKGVEHLFDTVTLARAIELFDPDVVHFQWLPFPMIDRILVGHIGKGRRVVMTVHDTVAFQGSPTSFLQLIGLHGTLNAFHRLIVHTRSSSDRLNEEGIPREKVRLVPHGVLFSGGPVAGWPSVDLEKDLPSKDILFFGNLKAYKGVDLLLRGYKAALENGSGIGRLMIAGKAPGEEKHWEDQVRGLDLTDDVDLRLGHVPDEDLPELFSQSGIVAFPYRHIDASGSLMLALPYGRAIIATEVGLFSELFEHAESAYLVPPNDWISLGEAISSVASDDSLRLRLARGSLSLAASHLDWETIAAQTIEAYQ